MRRVLCFRSEFELIFDSNDSRHLGYNLNSRILKQHRGTLQQFMVLANHFVQHSADICQDSSGGGVLSCFLANVQRHGICIQVFYPDSFKQNLIKHWPATFLRHNCID